MQKKMRRNWFAFTTFLLLISLIVGCNGSNETNSQSQSETDGDELKGTITMWGWDTNYIEVVSKEFNKVYPDIKIELTNVAAEDYLQKVQTTLASGGELPDILWGERNYRGKIFELDIWENLEAEPYKFDKSLVFDYLDELTTSPKGEVIALEQSLTPGGLAYRRDLAKEYFGTDDPKELEAMFQSIDDFIEKGKEVQVKSGGEVYMFSSLGELNEIFTAQSQKPLMDGEVVDVSGKMREVIDNVVKVRDAGIVDKLELWSPQWNASFADGKHIFFPAANWAPQYVIKPNDKDGEGRWGLMKPPGNAYSWGGTVFGISKDSKEKDLAWTFMNWLLLTKEGAEASKLVNFYIPLKSVYDDPEFVSSEDPFFNNQDVGKFWMEEIVPELEVPKISASDSVVKDATNLILNLLNSDPDVGTDEAISKLKDEVEAKLPDKEIK
ncbi:extracellular solute-binding protein [Metabacillus litoralis]|uniref:Extracellular solute-binding protein n=1 Tax=Metabacillus litoralis TaxID=152268 RepID=A0A5C6W9X1_9BACI|nr:extracellular solute-binding protein [Metabacillus litoralis]TXC92659.1 extracellular solute-binding protein [Metabacillus litoralis]